MIFRRVLCVLDVALARTTLFFFYHAIFAQSKVNKASARLSSDNEGDAFVVSHAL